MLCRLVRRQEETKAQRGQMKQLKGLMHGLVNVTGDPAKQQLDAIRNARELAFLITDLQDSTAMASANPVAFRKVQDIHDTVSFRLLNTPLQRRGSFQVWNPLPVVLLVAAALCCTASCVLQPHAPQLWYCDSVTAHFSVF